MFDGCTVALITPFDENCNINFSDVEALAELHLRSGTDGIVVAGCTGESFTLSDSERIEVYRAVRSVVGTQMKVLVGTGAVSTVTAVEHTVAARDAGADGVLVITPYANKPSQNALIDYFISVAKVGIPVILYNVPGRTGTTIAPETVVELSKVNNIVAIKEASGSLDAVSHILACSDLTVLSGDDSLTIPMMAIGAEGVISTTANLYPAEFAEMVHSAQNADFQRAGEIHRRLFSIMKALFIEGNPVPLKTAMAFKRMISCDKLRPPLTSMTETNRKKLFNALEEFES